MDARKYDRLKKWGGIFQQLRNQRTLSTGEKLMLELLAALGNDYDRCLQLFDFLQKIDEPIDTSSIAIALQIGKESMIQTLRALREGGFELEFYASTSNWYEPLKIPQSSMLQWLISKRVRSSSF